MFNFTTICESVRRHWLVIALVAVLSLALGVGSSVVKNGEINTAPSYTAEAVLYVASYGYDTKDNVENAEYNYNLSEGYALNDVRRLVLSNEVSGSVRAEFGDKLTISAPHWIDEKTNHEIEDRFVAIDVVGEDKDAVIAAANKAAQLTIAQAKDLLPVSEITVAEPAALKTSDGSRAANWGKDGLTPEENLTVDSGISKKSVVIYLFVGLVLSIGGFACYDILSRRIRSPRDIERLLDIPVLAHFGNKSEQESLSSNVRVLLKRNDFKTVTVAVLGDEAALAQVEKTLDKTFVQEAAIMYQDALASEKIAKSDACLLVVKEGFNKGNEIESAMKDLIVADVPVLGAVFIPKKTK